ncbi:MAG: glycosyltransferase family 1 protein [Patescibacteria group bacterium]
MKTIGIDCRFARTQSGLGRYTRSIVTELLNRKDPLEYVLFVRCEQEAWLQGIDHCRLHIADYAHYSLAEQLLFPGAIRDSGIDLLFSPHFNVPLLCPVPFVATIHDLILHRHPGDASFLKRMAYRMQMACTIKRAKAILAVSSFTALEIGGVYGPPALRKCQRTGEGVENVFHPASIASVAAVRTRYGLQRPFFLYVGSGKKHKNVQFLIDAFTKADLHEKNLVLVMQSCPPSLPAGVMHLPAVSDEDLPALYSAAECFTTASLYEGFCLPVAEALSCGCPVIAMNATAAPETAKGQAMLLNTDSEAWTRAFKSPPMRPVHYSRPSWQDAAAKTAEVLLTV